MCCVVQCVDSQGIEGLHRLDALRVPGKQSASATLNQIQTAFTSQGVVVVMLQEYKLSIRPKLTEGRM